MARCEVIITGFAQEEPVMLRLTVSDKQANVTVSHDREQIGEGAYAAKLMLDHRAFDAQNIELARACYLVYEAKKFSETVESVGPLTWLKVHSMVSDPSNPKYRSAMEIDPLGLKLLEEWRTEFFLQPIAELKGRRFNLFN